MVNNCNNSFLTIDIKDFFDRNIDIDQKGFLKNNDGSFVFFNEYFHICIEGKNQIKKINNEFVLRGYLKLSLDSQNTDLDNIPIYIKKNGDLLQVNSYLKKYLVRQIKDTKKIDTKEYQKVNVYETKNFSSNKDLYIDKNYNILFGRYEQKNYEVSNLGIEEQKDNEIYNHVLIRDNNGLEKKGLFLINKRNQVFLEEKEEVTSIKKYILEFIYNKIIK